MSEKKSFPETNADIMEIVKWINELDKPQIQRYLSDGIDKDSRIGIIQKKTGEETQPLRWEDLARFKEEANTNNQYARAEKKVGFDDELTQLENKLNQLLVDTGRESETILTTESLVLIKSPACFIELTSEQLAQIKLRLTTAITESMNLRIQEIEASMATNDDETENQGSVDDDNGQKENDESSIDDGSDDYKIKIEWTKKISTGLMKISHVLDEEIQDVIDRLVSQEVERIREEISYFLDETEIANVLPVIYRLGIRTFSQLEEFDIGLALENKLISHEETTYISALKEKFGK